MTPAPPPSPTEQAVIDASGIFEPEERRAAADAVLAEVAAERCTVSGMETFETTQPWVVYRYGLTHDRWWPFWNSTRFLGHARIGMECAVCGENRVAKLRIPRFGEVPEPASGRHPAREAFLREHRHPDRGHPMSWKRPLLNMAAHREGLDLDLLAMRLDGDIQDGFR